MTEEEIEKRKQIKEQIRKLNKQLKNEPAMVIYRLPDKTKFEIKKLAQAEFCNDYGMALTFLIKFYNGMMPSGNEVVIAKLEEHELRLIALEKKPVEKPKVIKTLSGRKIKVNRK